MSKPSALVRSSPSRWVWMALPLAVGIWLRLRGIGNAEPFVDESGNILAALDLRARALIDPLGQGRPALAYLFSPAGWFPAHALEFARTMSTAAGMVTLVAIGSSLQLLAGRAAGLCGMWLWAVFPFAVFHERLALQDPFVTALLAGTLLLIIRGGAPGNSRSTLWFFAAGVLIGTAVLFKISALFAVLWLVPLYVAIQTQPGRRVFSRQLAFAFAGGLVPLLLLGGDLLQLGAHSARFGSLPAFDAANYWSAAAQRLKKWLAWYAGYGGWPLGILWFGSIYFACRQPTKLRGLISASVVGSLLAVLGAAAFYNRPFARYMMPDQLPLIIALGIGWSDAVTAAGRLRLVSSALFLAALARWTQVSWQVGTAPERADVPKDEIEQYFTGAWSGRGVDRVRSFLTRYADEHHVRCFVLTHGFMRPGCYGLLLAERDDARIKVVPFSLYFEQDWDLARRALRETAQSQPAAYFILFEGSLYSEPPWISADSGSIRSVYEVPRGGTEKFVLYQWIGGP